MREKAKELQRQRLESVKKGSMNRGGASYGMNSSEGFGSSGGMSNQSSSTTPSISMTETKHTPIIQ